MFGGTSTFKGEQKKKQFKAELLNKKEIMYNQVLKKYVPAMDDPLFSANNPFKETNFTSIDFSSKFDNQAANGPEYPPAPDQLYPEINFVPSGNPPDIDLGAPKYDKEVAERRRTSFLTMKHTIKEKMELYTSSTKGLLEDLRTVLTSKE